MDRKARIQSELYDQNSCGTLLVVIVNCFVGLAVAGVEIGLLFYVWSLEHLKYQTNQFMVFGESMPGIWLGFLFIVTAIVGIIARQTRMDPSRRHVRFTIFATLCAINVIASAFMIGWAGYSIDRLRWDYPQLCKGFPYAGTYDHICDYENGFYYIVGFLGPMIFLYGLEAAVSFVGAVFAFQKVCNAQYKKLQSNPVYVNM